MTVANSRGVRCDGVWVAHDGSYEDAGGVVPFATELEALRYALPMDMYVTFVRFEETLRDAIRGKS